MYQMHKGKTLIDFITAMKKLLHSQTIAIMQRPIRSKKGARLYKELISTIYFSSATYWLSCNQMKAEECFEQFHCSAKA